MSWKSFRLVPLGGRRRLLVVLAYMGTPVLPAAEPKNDPVVARGENVAQLICADCHVVAPNQQFSPALQQPTPSFEEIANHRGATVKSITTFLQKTHWDAQTVPITMPNLVLPADDRIAVARYILSLKSKP